MIIILSFHFRKNRRKQGRTSLLVPFLFLLIVIMFSVLCYTKTLCYLQGRLRLLHLDSSPLTKKDILRHHDFTQSHHHHPVFHYALNPAHICDTFIRVATPIRVLICVRSVPENFHLRGWLRWTYRKHKNLKFVFLLGKSEIKPSIDHLVKKESRSNNDIIQGNFTDMPLNKTYKTMMGFRWATKHCPQAQYIVFQDETFKINPAKMMSIIEERKRPNLLYAGNLVKKEERTSKRHNARYIPNEEYPLRFLPSYISSSTFLVSKDVALKLEANLNSVKIVRLDDVFLGLVALLSDVILVHLNMTFDKCVDSKFQEILVCDMFKTTEDALRAWRDFTNNNVRIMS